MVPAAPTASHRNALRQATPYRRWLVPLFSARHVPAPAWDEPVTGVLGPALACSPAGPLAQPASTNAAVHKHTAAPAATARPPGRRRSRRASNTMESYSRPRAGAVRALGAGPARPWPGRRYVQAPWAQSAIAVSRRRGRTVLPGWQSRLISVIAA